ncbi:hypothetical protein E2C01_079120 [Portunus trituberculatus]|uniref:Uncharacterized protein n=1 Tax=Portunus trituberculatus TaxID=210409 RepID=A0A5B7IKN0_PORTR|nr:hypothetical protein [Portunus trituberculatus]
MRPQYSTPAQSLKPPQVLRDEKHLAPLKHTQEMESTRQSSTNHKNRTLHRRMRRKRGKQGPMYTDAWLAFRWPPLLPRHSATSREKILGAKNQGRLQTKEDSGFI